MRSAAMPQFCRLKHSKILSGVFFIQVTASLSPTIQAASQICDVLEALCFQIIRYHERKTPSWTNNQNLFIPWKLIQVISDPERCHFMRIRQTFELSPVVQGTHVQNVGLFIEQDRFVQLCRRDHVHKWGSV